MVLFGPPFLVVVHLLARFISLFKHKHFTVAPSSSHENHDLMISILLLATEPQRLVGHHLFFPPCIVFRP